MAIIDTVVAYAEKAGWHLHPCKLNKHPLLDNWPNRATSDPETLKQYWEEFPGASVGLACGPKSGVWVLDVDLPDGPEALKRLEGSHGKLPPTLTQTTGSGGVQYFWKWNGSPIRNSSRKIGAGLDIRGSGGYVIVPPSNHPSGNRYKWNGKHEIVSPPTWLVELVRKQKQPSQKKTYGEAALAAELANLGRSIMGGRNDTLNSAAYSLGQLVAGGELDHGAVAGALLGVAVSIGLPEKESRATIDSGMKSGASHPRSGENNSGFGELSGEAIASAIDSTVDTVDSVDNSGNLWTDVDTCRQTGESVDSCRQLVDSCRQLTGLPLASAIQEWACNSPGSFTNADIDREFCLTTRAEKKNRSIVLARAYADKKIKKDKRKKGVWYAVEQTLDFVDLDAEEPEAFPINLPFGINDYVMIPPKAIIVVAGTFNAGKTAFILNTLRLNLEQEYNRLYMMSEMGSAEYKTRIKQFGNGVDPWRRVKAANKSYDFDGAITHNNQDGLTCIDFLEEVDGEYYKIPTDIRNVYDALGNGVALIAIQKRTDQDFGRGGQGTAEKARLVMNLDYMCTGEMCVYCALKLVKVKHYLKRNLQGHEIHFRLENGCQITPITDWMMSSRVNRKKCISQYEAGAAEDEDEAIHFVLTTGKRVRIIARDMRKWQESFQNIDVGKELTQIAIDNMRKRFLTDKYFFQLPALLQKRNDKVEEK